jgi:hypothetical protein
MTKTGALGVLNDKLQKNIKSSDIEYVLKLTNRDRQPNRLKMVFHEKGKKSEIFKQRTKLKGGDREIWLANDLTKRRN